MRTRIRVTKMMRNRIHDTGWQCMTTYLSESESETAFFFLGGAAGFFLGFGASSSESEFGCNKITPVNSRYKGCIKYIRGRTHWYISHLFWYEGYNSSTDLNPYNHIQPMRIRILARLCRHKKLDLVMKNILYVGMS